MGSPVNTVTPTTPPPAPPMVGMPGSPSPFAGGFPPPQDVFVRSTPPTPAPTPGTGTGGVATALPPLPEIPPPCAIAPHVCHPGTGSSPTGSFQNNFFNNNNTSVLPGGYAAAPQPQGFPPQPPAPLPAADRLPPQQQSPAQPPAASPLPPAQTPPPSNINPLAGVDKTLEEINARLNQVSTNDSERVGAAGDLLNLLQKNPGLAEHPMYRQHVQALLVKVLRDTSPAVRQAALIALSLDDIQVEKPIPELEPALLKLTQGHGLENLEPGIAKEVLAKLRNPGLSKPPPAAALPASTTLTPPEPSGAPAIPPLPPTA